MKSLSPNTPHLIVMVGLPGSGRSTFAEKFSSMFNAPLIDFDLALPLARDAESVEKMIDFQLDQVLKTKASIVYDGPSYTRTDRMNLAKKARDAGYAVMFIWVQVDEATAKNRSSRQIYKPWPIDDHEFDRLKRKFTPLDVSEKPVVISGKHTYAAQVKIVLRRLTESRQPTIAVERPVEVTAPRRRGPILIR